MSLRIHRPVVALLSLTVLTLALSSVGCGRERKVKECIESCESAARECGHKDKACGEREHACRTECEHI